MGILVLQSTPNALSQLGHYILRDRCAERDPLGSLFFCLVLHKLVATLASDEEASHLLYHKWYMDDGVVAGTRDAMARVIAIIKEQGPHLGLFIKDPKCELFSKCNLNSFPGQMKRSNTPNLVLLGAPIRDLIFCAKYIVIQSSWSAFQVAAD